jgi:hypothetical protein
MNDYYETGYGSSGNYWDDYYANSPYGDPGIDPNGNTYPASGNVVPWAPGYTPGPDEGFITPAPAPTGGGGGMSQFGGLMAPDYGFYSDAPAFDWNNPYGDFSYDSFSAPTPDSIFADPGYQFRVQQGQQSLEQSAAGRGVLRTGGTLKDILNYGQSMASQEYGNVFDRAQTTYGTNRQNAFDNYMANYGNAFNLAREQYAPKLLSWQEKMALQKSAADNAFQRDWDVYKWNNPSADTIYVSGLD